MTKIPRALGEAGEELSMRERESRFSWDRGRAGELLHLSLLLCAADAADAVVGPRVMAPAREEGGEFGFWDHRRRRRSDEARAAVWGPERARESNSTDGGIVFPPHPTSSSPPLGERFPLRAERERERERERAMERVLVLY